MIFKELMGKYKDIVCHLSITNPVLQCYLFMEKIKDRHILVTGATGTIGEAVVGQLAASGAILYITGRNREKLEQLGLQHRIPSARIFHADLGNEQEIRVMMDAIHQLTPALDILINAAGIGIIKPFEQLSREELMRTMEVNFLGVYTLLQQVLPAMKQKGKGIIINMPGVLGKTPMAGATAYAASKYALNGFMKSLREELKRTEIRITQLYLGGVDSRFWDSIDLRVQREKMIVAAEAARAVWFLCQQPESGVVSEMVLQPFNHQAI